MKQTLLAATPEETEAAGAALARDFTAAHPGERLIVALRGDLGAGKTVYVRGIASVLSPGSRVKSPTYTLVNEYRHGPVPLFHFDLYRAEGADDLASLGMDEYLAAGHCVVEWSEYLPAVPDGSLVVTITPQPDGSRRITVSDSADQ